MMRGLPAPDAETIRYAALRHAPIMRAQLSWLEAMLCDGRHGMVSPETTIADFAIYHALWFITAHTDAHANELTPYPRNSQ
jgi:glutathione S-transferase